MSVRSVGGDAPVPAAPEGPADATAPAAVQGQPTAGQPTALRDGVEATRQAQETTFGAFPPGTTAADTHVPGDPKALSEVLAELAGGKLGADAAFLSLPPAVQEAMLAALESAPGLAEIFKHLTNSPNFRKLSPEVQTAVVELLAKLGGDKAEAQAVERLVRSPEFGALPAKEQLKMLEKLAASPEAREALLQQASTSPAQAPSSTGPTSDVSFNAPLDPITQLQIANLMEAIPTGVGSEVDAVPPDPEHGQSLGEGGAPSPYQTIKRLVAQLCMAPTLSKIFVEQTLGLILAPTAEMASVLEGRVAKGPFHRVVLSATDSSWLLDLEVRPRVNVLYKEFRGDLIPASAEPHLDPEIPPDGLMSFRLRLAGGETAQELHFAFGIERQRLRGVSLQRQTAETLN